MADIFTGATTAAGTGQLSNQVLTAYQRVAFMALRARLYFDQTFRVKPGNLTSPGNPVTFFFWSDLAEATTALTETVDVDAVGLSDSTVSVTPAEYGNAVLVTARIKADDVLIGFSSDVSNIVNRNMVQTIDRLARNAMDAAGTEDYQGQSAEASITATDVITGNSVRKKRAQLAGDEVERWTGESFLSFIHPDVRYDLVSETGDAAWIAPALYAGGTRVLTGEVGMLDQVRHIETSRCKINTDGGSGTVDTYTTYYLGNEAYAKAESIPMHMVIGPVTDKLRRFQPLGWHIYAGWGELRSAASRRLLSASSIGAN